MKTIQSNYKIIIILSIMFGIMFLAQASIGDARAAERQLREHPHWLEQFRGKMVKVTFSTVPPDKKQIESVRLDSIESNGIVVKYTSPNQIFYPFSSIISIDP
jgi:hypothetical protein